MLVLVDMCRFKIVCFFFFKQKTAYGMRISDWSSDVCSSDLQVPPAYSAIKLQGQRAYDLAREGEPVDLAPRRVRIDAVRLVAMQIGRASCRERVWQYV